MIHRITLLIMLYMFFGVLLLGCSKKCIAKENDISDINDEMQGLIDDYADIDGMENKLGADISFRDIYTHLLSGDVEGALNKTFDAISRKMTKEMLENRSMLLRLLVLIIIAAVFNNYSSVLKYSYVGEQGFFITYLMAVSILIKSFFLIYELAEATIENISSAMECMLPAFMMSLVMCSGIATSQMTNSIFVFVLTILENFILYGLLPMIRIYFLILLLNQLNGKDRFSKLAELIKQIVEWVLKGFVTAVIGINAVKSMLIPVYENVRLNMIQKGIAMIPGGSAVTNLSGMMMGAGVLIKNSVGLTAAIVLFIIGSIPLFKMVYFYISYRLVLAAAQPISDKRILAGVQGACDSTAVLIKTVMTAISLCVISIAIIIMSTSAGI